MWYSLWYNAPTMLPGGGRPAGNIVGVYIIYIRLSILFIFHYICLRIAKQSQFIPLQNVVYFITLPFLARKIFTFYINDVLLFKCQFPGPKG